MCAISARALALWCALLLTGARASAYTVDCNPEYTDCDTELSKLTLDDEEVVKTTEKITATQDPQPANTPNIGLDPVMNKTTEIEETTKSDIPEVSAKPQPRLLNLNVDELQNFANALHNDTNEKGQKKIIPDLSDVTLDGDEDDDSRIMPLDPKIKDMPDKFYTNLQAPFHSLITAERDRGSEEIFTCKDNDITYKLGDRIDRDCEEMCECTTGGVFECSPRCKHPYIRRGRRLNDPLCFESPVDECCSIIACATGTDKKTLTQELCQYGNETHVIGSKWNIGCEQTCVCEHKSIVTCKPRCSPLPVSDKCINVQDPNDQCCEVQVCDVSHDVHEEPENATTSTTTPRIDIKSTTEILKGFEEYDDHENVPKYNLKFPEAIGSVKVLQNNSVQVNLMHMNESNTPIHLLLSSDGGNTFSDVELKYSNMILNLEGGKDYILKAKESGTKFNFTITTTDSGTNGVPYEAFSNDTKIGCYQDGQFYAVGDEFHVGCEQLCECTGMDTHECAALVCPSHVGLELVSKGCVRWAPSPPASPPNCCPRTARCLSDGTCHYKGVAVPNWSEVPINLTGCEQRCFCENGELDCQNVCSPLPPVPPQSLRCSPNHRPSPVNISDEDCCKQWGCVPNAEKESNEVFQPYAISKIGQIMNYITPVVHILTTIPPDPPTDPITNDDINFYKHLSSVTPSQKLMKTVFHPTIAPKYVFDHPTPFPESHVERNNATVLDVYTEDGPLKVNLPETLINNNNNYNNWGPLFKEESTKPMDSSKIPLPIYNYPAYFDRHNNLIANEKNVHKINSQTNIQTEAPKQTFPDKSPIGYSYQPIQKNFFVPTYDKVIPMSDSVYSEKPIRPLKFNTITGPIKNEPTFFGPLGPNNSIVYHVPKVIRPVAQNIQYSSRDKSISLGKHVTILNVKDMKTTKINTKYNGDPWNEETQNHLMPKLLSPYETVLLRPVPNSYIQKHSRFNPNQWIPQTPNKPMYSTDIEHWLNQMERKSVMNKNLRSANKEQRSEGQTASEAPPFLPTVIPEVQYPHEDIDYDQNNIHRPANPIEPAVAGLPPGLTLPPYGDNNRKLSVISLQADSPTSVKMLFGLPPVLVGLRGSVDLRYTDKTDQDISHWYSQVFAPADEILTTPRLEFRLTGLKPATTYKIRGKLYLHNLPVEPESEIYNIRTQDLPSAPMEEKRREIDCRLTVTDVNDTTAHVTWRHFEEQELIYIDGIQVRYRPVGTPIYSMTELLHHSRSAAELHDLRPDTKYETSLVLVPPPRSTTELIDPAKVEFKTSPYVDPYNWTVNIEVRAVGAGAAEVWWSGVPAPAERWVRVFRAAHACKRPGGTDRHDLHDIHSHHGHEMDMHAHDHDRYERDAFRLAARDLPPGIKISGLLPDTKCRVWLELFLTNGKVKTSNVLEINTKSLDHPEPIDNEIESSSSVSGRRGDYYGALVGVGAVAVLGAFSSLLLLLIVLRRHRPRSVPITSVPSAPRESSLPPYDNPAYKLELQQETMDL